MNDLLFYLQKNGYSINVPEENVYLFLIFIRSQDLSTRFNVTGLYGIF